MKKRLLSLALALCMCLSLMPAVPSAEAAAALTKTVEGLHLAFGDQQGMDRVTVDETEKKITSGLFNPPSYYSLSITGNGVSPYCVNIKQVDLTLNNVSLRPTLLDTYPLYLSDRSLTLQGENTVSVSEESTMDNEVDLIGVTISGDGSLSVKDLNFCLANTRLTEGSLYAETGDCHGEHDRIRGVVTDYEGFIMDGGSLTVKQGDYFDPTDAALLKPPAAPILLRAPTVINGGKIFVESGTDLRTGKPIPCIDLGSYYNTTGSLTINGGIFNVGDLDANTVLGYPVASDCQVVKNQDPATKEMYPFEVQKSTEALVIYPKNPVANPQNELQLRAVGTASENVTWSLSGSHHPDTTISSDGTLFVSFDETAKNLTVTAQGEGGASVSTTVSLEPEIFDIWFIIQEWYGYEYTVYDHKQLKRREVYTLPLIENIPGFKHLAWNDSSNPYYTNEYAIGTPIVADHSEVYWTKLEESEENFMIGGVSYAMPKVGGCVNSTGGTTKTGDWWLELPSTSCPELTLNGVELSTKNVPSYNGQSDQIMIPAKKKLTIHVRGDNKILPPKASPEISGKLCAIHQALDSSSAQVIMDLEKDSTLTVQGRPGQVSTLLDFGETPLTLQGSGKLCLLPEAPADDLIHDYYVNVAIRDHAVMEYDTTHLHTASLYHWCPLQTTVMSEQSTLLFKGDGLPLSLGEGAKDLTLPADGSMHITAGPSPDGQGARTLTYEEFLEQLLCLRYIKISPDPVPAHTPSYPLWLGSVQVTEENKSDILGDGKASYDPASATLTLNNVQITAPGGKIPPTFSGLTYTGKQLTIQNTGNSTFTGADNGPCSLGFFHHSPYRDFGLKIKGEGVLRFVGGSRADESYGGMAACSQSVNIDGSVKMELVGKTCFFHDDALWFGLSNSTTGTVLCSSSLSGSDPAPWTSVAIPDKKPYAVFYRPSISSLGMQYATYDNDEWKDIRYLVPLIGLTESKHIYLRPRVADQMGIEMDTRAMIDQFSWAVSGEASSANLAENLNSWGKQKITIDEEQASIDIDAEIEPCYIGLELTHIPTGKRLALPAFLVSDKPFDKIEVQIKPEYEDKVYREGDNFDFNSIIVTRIYPNIPSNRHPEAFQCDYLSLFDGVELRAGQQYITIEYQEYVKKSDTVFAAQCEIPITVLGNSSMVQDSDGVRVTSPTAATLVIASYDSRGRMTAVNTHAIPADTKDQLFALAAGQKAFLLDKSTGTPLCEAVRS